MTRRPARWTREGLWRLLLDLSKAFDTVSHIRLLEELAAPALGSSTPR